MGISAVKLTIMDLSMNKNKNQYFSPNTKIKLIQISCQATFICKTKKNIYVRTSFDFHL